MKPNRRYLVTRAAALTALIVASPVCAQSASVGTLQPASGADAIARVARLRADSVVAVHTESAEGDSFGPALIPPAPEGLGSGVVIDAQGLVVTNAHVVTGAGAVHVRTSDGDDLPATVIGIDQDLDLALLRVSDARGLRPAPLGDSNRLRVGDWVIAIGNPFGLHHTVTAGIVSATARMLDDSGVEFIQTDAALSPGSSGGPLFDLAGAVVGINTGILGSMNVGLNLAIPVATLKEVLPALRAGSVVHGWIGIVTSRLSPRGAATRDLPGGLIVTTIVEDGPAARAGLRPGDVIAGLADSRQVRLEQFYPHIRRRPPGTVMRLEVWRHGERRIVPVEVGRRSGPD